MPHGVSRPTRAGYANHYFYAGAALRGLPTNRREESWLRFDEPLGREYWAHHNSAANYEVANRHVIVRGVRAVLEDVFSASGEVFYEISHNLVQQETLVLPDGSTKRGFVHRKGATRAFPAGHPDLDDTVWSTTGHPCLVPGSMYQGAAILYPLDGAYASGCSLNHGAGRVMARGAAKRNLAAVHDKIDAEMREVVRTLRAASRVAASWATRSARRSTSARTSTKISTPCSACSRPKASRALHTGCIRSRTSRARTRRPRPIAIDFREPCILVSYFNKTLIQWRLDD
jgi:RNA-splicing ligase RtcB